MACWVAPCSREAALAVSLGPAHEQVPQVILPRHGSRKDRGKDLRTEWTEEGAAGKRVAGGEWAAQL